MPTSASIGQTRFIRKRLTYAVLLLGYGIGNFGLLQSIEAATPPSAEGAKADPPGIHNLLKLSDKLYSGSEPEGENGFASLQALGVKSVVSVDGAKPNVELARKYGIRYIHIPIGYDGVPAEAGAGLARVAREAEPPVYVHCHHGKHRGPTAAAITCIAAGSMDNKQAIGVLVRAGTSKDYRGLWRDVEAYKKPPADAKLPDLVEIAEVGSFAAAMSQVDRAFDNLKLCREAKWAAPAAHPDLVPADEALLVQEGMHEARRNLAAEQKAHGDEFEKWLSDAESLATNLRGALKANDSESANKQASMLEQACKQCHTKYRDN